eukprot:120366_1
MGKIKYTSTGGKGLSFFNSAIGKQTSNNKDDQTSDNHQWNNMGKIKYTSTGGKGLSLFNFNSAIGKQTSNNKDDQTSDNHQWNNNVDASFSAEDDGDSDIQFLYQKNKDSSVENLETSSIEDNQPNDHLSNKHGYATFSDSQNDSSVQILENKDNNNNERIQDQSSMDEKLLKLVKRLLKEGNNSAVVAVCDIYKISHTYIGFLLSTVFENNN